MAQSMTIIQKHSKLAVRVRQTLFTLCMLGKRDVVPCYRFLVFRASSTCSVLSSFMNSHTCHSGSAD